MSYSSTRHHHPLSGLAVQGPDQVSEPLRRRVVAGTHAPPALQCHPTALPGWRPDRPAPRSGGRRSSAATPDADPTSVQRSWMYKPANSSSLPSNSSLSVSRNRLFPNRRWARQEVVLALVQQPFDVGGLCPRSSSPARAAHGSSGCRAAACVWPSRHPNRSLRRSPNPRHQTGPAGGGWPPMAGNLPGEHGTGRLHGGVGMDLELQGRTAVVTGGQPRHRGRAVAAELAAAGGGGGDRRARDASRWSRPATPIGRSLASPQGRGGCRRTPPTMPRYGH